MATTASPNTSPPFADRPVRRDHDAAALVVPRDELEEQVRGMLYKAGADLLFGFISRRYERRSRW